MLHVALGEGKLRPQWASNALLLFKIANLNLLV
jgi:hypothetical protein